MEWLVVDLVLDSDRLSSLIARSNELLTTYRQRHRFYFVPYLARIFSIIYYIKHVKNKIITIMYIGTYVCTRLLRFFFFLI